MCCFWQIYKAVCFILLDLFLWFTEHESKKSPQAKMYYFVPKMAKILHSQELRWIYSYQQHVSVRNELYWPECNAKWQIKDFLLNSKTSVLPHFSILVFNMHNWIHFFSCSPAGSSWALRRHVARRQTENQHRRHLPSHAVCLYVCRTAVTSPRNAEEAADDDAFSFFLVCVQTWV